MGFTTNVFIISVLGYQLLSNCGVCEIQDCKAKLDMVIIVDSSMSVGKANFEMVTAFLKNLIGYLPVHPDSIRVSLIRYHSKADIISYLDEDMNKTEKAAVAASMAYRGGGTSTHLALRLARTAVLTPERGDRPDVPNLVILSTDGKSTNENATSAEAAALKANENLKIFVIGIGKEVADQELVAVASRPEMVYKLTDFSQLTEILGNLARFSCSDMKEDSISELKAWPNSGATFTLPTPKASSTSQAKLISHPSSTAPSRQPSTESTKTQTSTPFPSTSTLLPVTLHSTHTFRSETVTTFRSSVVSSALKLSTNKTTIPSKEFYTTDDTAFLSTTQEQTSSMHEGLYNSNSTTRALVKMPLSSFNSTSENENKTESTLKQTTITADPTLFNAKTFEIESTLEQKITTGQSTLLDTTNIFDIETQSSSHVFTKGTSTKSSTEAQTSTEPTSYHTTRFPELSRGVSRALDGSRTSQRSTAYFHPPTSSVTSVTSTAESFLFDADSTQSDHVNVRNFTELFSSAKSSSYSSVSQRSITTKRKLASQNSSIAYSTKASTHGKSSPSLVTESTTVGIPKHITIIGKTSSSFLDKMQPRTANKTTVLNTLPSIITTAAPRKISKSTFRGPGSTGVTHPLKSTPAPAVRQPKRASTSRNAATVTHISEHTSQKPFSQSSTNATSFPQHQRRTVDSRTTFHTNDVKPSVSPTQKSTIIDAAFEEYLEKDNTSRINNATIENMPGQTGGDLSSRDVYIFIAGGSATAIVLLAMGTFLAVLCRKRNSSRNLEPKL